MNDNVENDPRMYAIPDVHGHAKGEHKAFTDERPIPLSARMLFLWFYHACRRGWPRFLMVTDHMNYLTFEDPAAISLVRRALKLAQAGDLYGAAETASVEVGHAAVVSEGLRRGMRYSIGAEVDNDPRSRPDAQNIVDAMKPDGMIRSVHFLTIDHPTYGPNWSWPFDNSEFSEVYEVVGTDKTWELYIATLLDAVERLPGNILGHFYVPALFGHWPDDATLDEYEDRIIDACEARGMAIEFNTRFLYRGHSDEEKAKYLAVHRRLLVKCKSKNVGIAVGSDAHSPKDQSRQFDTVLTLLDECGINELVFPIAGRLLRVALRVPRKAEQAAAPETPPLLSDERKSVRRARTSEAPARSKDSSSKRDEPDPAEEPSGSDDAPPKPKPRPKRSKNRAAPSGDEPIDTKAAAGGAARIASEDAPFDEPLSSGTARAPGSKGPTQDGGAASRDGASLPPGAGAAGEQESTADASRAAAGENRATPNEAQHRVGVAHDDRTNSHSVAAVRPSVGPRAGELESPTLAAADDALRGSAGLGRSDGDAAADALAAGQTTGADEPAIVDQTTRMPAKKRIRSKAASAGARSSKAAGLDLAGSSAEPAEDRAVPQDVAGDVGLDAADLDAAGLDVAGLDAVGLDAAGLDVADLDAAGLDAAGLDAASLDVAGLDAVGLDVVASLEEAVILREEATILEGDAISEEVVALEDAAILLVAAELEDAALDAPGGEEIAADADLDDAPLETAALEDEGADASSADAIASEPVDDEPIVVLTTSDMVIEAEFEPIVSTVVEIEETGGEDISGVDRPFVRVDLDGDDGDEVIDVDATGAVVRLDFDEDEREDGSAATQSGDITSEPEYESPLRTAQVTTGAAKAKGSTVSAKAKNLPAKSKPAATRVAKPGAEAIAKKTAAKKAAAKKASAKKAAAKKASVKKASVKKAAVSATAGKKAGAKKIAAKKSNAKKPTPKRR